MRHNLRKLISLASLFSIALALIISCSQSPQSSKSKINSNLNQEQPIVIGYSNWAGWWPWAIAEEEGLFAKNDLNIKLQWFEGYLDSLEAFAAGQLDGNCQTLNDTIAFAADAVNGEVIILVNDNSAGNDKIIATEEINTVEDLQGKEVAVEGGIVTDFLLNLALESKGLKRENVTIIPLETSAAAAAFAAGQFDAVSAFPPYWLNALQRKGSKELISSQEFPGAIPDLLTVSQKLIEEKPDTVQGLVNTWFDILNFIENNPRQADEIMAARVNITVDELQLFKEGTKIFNIEDNLQAFQTGESMKYLPFAAQKIAKFMVDINFISKSPDLRQIFDDRFIKTYAKS